MNFEKSLPASAHKRLWAKVPPRKGGGGAESREGQEADEGRQAAQLPAETLLPGDSNVVIAANTDGDTQQASFTGDSSATIEVTIDDVRIREIDQNTNVMGTQYYREGIGIDI
jgi:hypothetical protein